MTSPDLHRDRPLADDALRALERFRDTGSRSFEAHGVTGARELYEQSCAVNGLPSDPIARVEDFQVLGRFTVRLYDPVPGVPASNAVVFLHGGGWLFGSLDTHDSLCRRLASATGAVVLAVDYRLAPEHPYPAALEDARDAFAWILDSAGPHGLDVRSIILAGDSAGGQLAAVLTSAAVAPETARIVGQVLLYPVTDLTMQSASYRRVTSGLPLVAQTMRWFADHYVPADADRSAPDLSPLRHEIPDGIPPTYVVTVDHDPLADEGIAYAAALARSGVNVTHVHLAGYAHGLFTSAGVIPRGAEVLDDVASFVRGVFGD